MERWVAACEAAAYRTWLRRSVSRTPTFKDYASDELAGCGKNRFPAFSITGGACALGCDHCQAKILAPMIAATTPGALERKVRDLVLLQDPRASCCPAPEPPQRGALRAVPAGDRPASSATSRISGSWRTRRCSNAARARALADAGIDTNAMMDVIGAAATICEVYHLDRPVADFEATSQALCTTGMAVAAYRDRPALRPHPWARRSTSSRATGSRPWCWWW
jgi:hypothetical protein